MLKCVKNLSERTVAWHFMNCAFCIVQDDCQNANHTNSLPYIEGNSLILSPVSPRVMCHLSVSFWRHYICT